MATTSSNLCMNPNLNGNRGTEAVSFLAFSDALARKVPHTTAMLLTTLPRGGVQIVQPQRLADSLVKPYGREFSTEDRPTWRALVDGGVITTSDTWTDGSFDNSRYYGEFLKPNGLRHVAAVAIKDPVIEGYPGVIWIGRTAEQGEFSQAEVQALEEAAREFEAGLEAKRGRQEYPAWVHQLPTKVLIFDQNAQPLYPANGGNLDASLREHMVQHVRQLLQRMEKEAVDPERVLLPDSNGDLWVFRATPFAKFAALGQGPIIFFCLQPQWADWANVSVADLAADQELARLVPALKFMAQNFKKSPTLTEIAKTVHLSPFHFHRRFTELVGLTPKHYLLECQIHEAKQQLVSQTRPLPEIATDCGFAHQSHFTSRFKQTTGLTPTRWRRLALRLNGSTAQ